MPKAQRKTDASGAIIAEAQDWAVIYNAFSNGIAALYRVHDFRVTCETRLAHLGFSQDIRDAVLGHAKPGLQRAYNKHDYMAEKRRALEAYAAHIMEVVG